MMDNLVRFIIGIAVSLVIVAAGVIVFILLLPLILGGGIAAALLIGGGAAVFFIVMLFAFIWYMARKEPEMPKGKHSRDYSIKQGKDV
ncbi:MAG: hypothetical protein R6U32_03945 [Candidatus Woesearchaeota archaeon]